MIVWHVAMPRSGSTWASAVLSDLLASRGWKITEALVPTYGHREQEVDPMQLLLRGVMGGNVFIRHQHCPYSEFAADFIRRNNIHLVLQVRDIPDCLVSYLDLFDYGDVCAPVAYMTPAQWCRLSHEEKMQFFVDLVAPWYVRFWAGWSGAIDRLPTTLVRYENLLDDPPGYFTSLARTFEPNIRREEVAASLESAGPQSTRFNRGWTGRGLNLPERARGQLDRYARYYKGTDFSLVLRSGLV